MLSSDGISAHNCSSLLLSIISDILLAMAMTHSLSSWWLCWLSWLRLRAKFYLIVTPQSPAFILTIFRETFIKMLILRIHNGDNILLWSPHWRLEADDSLWRMRHQDGRVDLGSGSIIFTTTIPVTRPSLHWRPRHPRNPSFLMLTISAPSQSLSPPVSPHPHHSPSQ